MSPRPLRITVLGLSLSSSWGNGHATTWRALLKALAARGHAITFLERDVPWYRAHRDFASVDYCDLKFYGSLDGLSEYDTLVAQSDAVILGSYVPDGIAVARWMFEQATSATAFYDIDTPVTLSALRRGTCDYLAAEDIRRFDLYLSFTGGPVLRELEKSFGAVNAQALYCSVDEALYQPLDLPRTYDLTYLGTYSADRQPVLERLLIEPARRRPDLRFAVAGPQYPSDIAWPANVERIDHVPPADHAAFYNASRFTLNVTRADMVAMGYSPSVRLFEAAACGTPIISDRWDGIETVLRPGSEVRIADGPEDVLAAIGMPNEERRAMSHAARQHVLAQHTAAHRAAELEVALRAACAKGGAPNPSKTAPPVSQHALLVARNV